MKKSSNVEQIKKLKFRAINDASQSERLKGRDRFKEFCRQSGGISAVALRTGYSVGTIKGIQGNPKRLISPVMAHVMCKNFEGEIHSKYTREYLRSDLAPAQWERLDSIIKAI